MFWNKEVIDTTVVVSTEPYADISLSTLSGTAVWQDAIIFTPTPWPRSSVVPYSSSKPAVRVIRRRGAICLRYFVSSRFYCFFNLRSHLTESRVILLYLGCMFELEMYLRSLSALHRGRRGNSLFHIRTHACTHKQTSHKGLTWRERGPIQLMYSTR